MEKKNLDIIGNILVSEQMSLFNLIKGILNGNNTHALVFDFHHYRLVLLPKLFFIKFPDDYKYYKHPIFQIL